MDKKIEAIIFKIYLNGEYTEMNAMILACGFVTLEALKHLVEKDYPADKGYSLVLDKIVPEEELED